MPARVDRVKDPTIAGELLLARRGQAYFSRALRDLRDADLDGLSQVPGWDRRHVVAHVGLHARTLAESVEYLATGTVGDEHTPITSLQQWQDAVDLAATLPGRALRYLSDHAAVHLSVAWRDLPDALWSAEVTSVDGPTYPAWQTVRQRAREVWLGSLALAGRGRWEDVPEPVASRLLAGDGGGAPAQDCLALPATTGQLQTA